MTRVGVPTSRHVTFDEGREFASAAGSDYIVSGDNDLLGLGIYDSMKILNVEDLLDFRAHAPQR
jgi:hypothetical protein